MHNAVAVVTILLLPMELLAHQQANAVHRGPTVVGQLFGTGWSGWMFGLARSSTRNTVFASLQSGATPTFGRSSAVVGHPFQPHSSVCEASAPVAVCQ
jgi:hypothetical protein